MTSMETLARRVAALESRLNDLEGAYERSFYRLERRTVRVELDLGKVLTHLGVTPSTEEEIDARIDEA